MSTLDDHDSKQVVVDAKLEYAPDAKTTHAVAEQGYAATDIYGNPLVQFDPVEEAKLRRKIDLHVIPTVALLYLFCFIDRANIGNARLAGFEKDTSLQGYDYNLVLSVFYISYIVFEIPSNILCKWMGPGWFIPSISLGFGLMSICTAFVHTRAQAAAVRFLLGLFEAGMLPGIAYYLSRWYNQHELVFRISLYIVMSPLAGAFGGLLASGILKLDHVGSLKQWRMIFVIEGIITVGLALIAFVTLTDRPQTARWLTQEEKDLTEARLKSERVGQTEVLDKLDWTKAIRGMTNPMVIITSFMSLLINVTVQGYAFFLPTIVRTIYPKKSVISQQLHTVPPYIVGTFFTLLMPYLSMRFRKRVMFISICAPLCMVGYTMFLASRNYQVRYGATFFIASGSFVLGPIVTAQVSANSLSDASRSVAIGTMVMFSNIGGLVATWSYLPYDGPHFRIGNGLNLGTSSTIFLLSIFLFVWTGWDNKRRQKIDVDQALAGYSQKEIDDLDWKHPSFRWKN